MECNAKTLVVAREFQNHDRERFLRQFHYKKLLAEQKKFAVLKLQLGEGLFFILHEQTLCKIRLVHDFRCPK